MTTPRRAAHPTLAARIGAWLGIWRETPQPRRADPEYLAAQELAREIRREAARWAAWS